MENQIEFTHDFERLINQIRSTAAAKAGYEEMIQGVYTPLLQIFKDASEELPYQIKVEMGDSSIYLYPNTSFSVTFRKRRENETREEYLKNVERHCLGFTSDEISECIQDEIVKHYMSAD